MPLNNTARRALREYIDTERAQTVSGTDAESGPDSGRSSGADGDALFLSLRGTRLTERQIRELVKKYTGIALGTGRRAGYSPHKLRATTATSLIERGNSIFDVQEFLSHDNITTTQLYAAHRRGAKRELVKDMEWSEDG
jgi:site-specific recombinase XerD